MGEWQCTWQQDAVAVQRGSDGNIEVLKILLDWGCPLAAKDHNKQTILHHAARSGNTGVLKYVLQRWITAASSNGTCHVAASSNPKVYDLRRGGCSIGEIAGVALAFTGVCLIST